MVLQGFPARGGAEVGMTEHWRARGQNASGMVEREWKMQHEGAPVAAASVSVLS